MLIDAPLNDIGLFKLGSWGSDDSGDGLLNGLAKKDRPYTVCPVPNIVGMAGAASLVGFTTQTFGPVTILVIPYMIDVDAWAENYYYFRMAIEDAVALGPDAWVDLYDRAREVASRV